MPELADIFRRYGGEYIEKFGADMLPSHRRALSDILHCRTEMMGGHVYRCDECGREVYAYHSCPWSISIWSSRCPRSWPRSYVAIRRHCTAS